MKNKKRTTLLKLWTTRYLITLVVGLFLLGAGSFWWIKQTTLQSRLNLMEYLAVETSHRIVQSNGQIGRDPLFDRMLNERAKVLELDKEPELYITDLDGRTIFSRPPLRGPAHKNRKFPELDGVPVEVIEHNETTQKIKVQNEEVYAVKSPIMDGENKVGWVVLMQNSDELTDVKQEYRLLIVLLVGLGLLGWVVIYFLAKKLLRPIQEVAHAATQIREGNYEFDLNTSINEEEIFELVSSFKEMTNRLMQLEKLRAELLAGVTHDLKTPVTSISGLVQAVRDGIVKGEESKEFLDITLKEVGRLQTMIEDLLDFNSLSAGAFSIRPEHCHMNLLIKEIVREWAVTQQHPVHYQVKLPELPIYRTTDPLRLKQILINLLNNSYQAMNEHRSITVSLSEDSIDVKDTGTGIPLEEQPYIFERFFRGEKKKLKVRGLGLGLPFSKMLAKTLKADLLLKQSTKEGSTFSIVWNKE
ncbi:HAMP domain-containing sensor histidine kinase [Bacillus sp. 03113]|uniref:sensor histidine kinase n=1 Tax=Bacillus sp. 03113 TaxID=2578211 RepID=UPI00215B951B|nr:HAMP domain-containing sensor histidine kinase [Bacillus sp. 03113]